MWDLSGKSILVTGGLGFIGSHTAVVLVEAGARVTVVDNLSNSFDEVLRRMAKVLGDKFAKVKFEQVDVTSGADLTRVFANEKFDAVIHFAAFKAVGESVAKPLEYFQNNIGGAMALLDTMRKHNVKTLVFSSSCTVYGIPDRVPIDETCSLQAISPYGKTKLYVEELMRDLAASDETWKIVLLRYFNPVAAHPSGLMGEHPVGVPQNLMPFVQQVAVGIRDELKVYGDDYNTRDGTAIRDYIHVMDLADSHLAALVRAIDETKPPVRCTAINVGTGKGSTVLEMVRAFEAACGKTVPYSIVPRRAGDTEAVWAATQTAERELQWRAKYDIKDMCRDQWRWATKYPRGYEQPME